MLKHCERCGAEFTPIGGQRFCAACRAIHGQEYRKAYYKAYQKRHRAEIGETEAQKQWRKQYYSGVVKQKNQAANENRDSSTEARIREITAYYENCQSVKQTARHFMLSHSKCRRMLILAGAYVSEQSFKILTLREKGYTVPEIAEELGVTKKTVSLYLPYEKGEHGAKTRTYNAERIEKHRKKGDAK